MTSPSKKAPALTPWEKRLRKLLQHESWTADECRWLLRQPLSHELLALAKSRLALVLGQGVG
jgi:hypothetical protein